MPRTSREGDHPIDAVVFDLDGVVTRTARVHAGAWKQLFDEFLRERSERLGEPFRAFDVKDDYLAYVDGKPRYEGVRSFLASRAIDIPFGDSDHGPDRETACGLGNRKDRYFEERLHREGVEVFSTTCALIGELRSRGLRTAMVTSSKHGGEIVELAQLTHLFDAQVDGNLAERLGLPGKPAPDVFVKAAEMLGTIPARTIVVEDAVSGVEAGRRGGFALVLGVDRGGQPEALRRSGADVVVQDLGELSAEELLALAPKGAERLLPALAHLDALRQRLQGRRPAVFLDYDGTLTPIVARPELAVLSDEMRRTLEELAARLPTAIVSGRALADVRRLVGVEGLAYSGNHGFEIVTAAGDSHGYSKGREALPAVASARELIGQRIQEIPEAWIEDKTYSLSVHFRQVAEERVVAVEQAVDAVLADLPQLRKHFGKKVFEIRPRIEWNKGKAVLFLLETLGLAHDGIVPIYLGDDVTDEDAFRALSGPGLGVLVTDRPVPSAARFSLRDTGEVRRFLQALVSIAEEEAR
jgi:trehalose 6-phosphate phosphatase